jgi:hypothetical protein
VRQILPWRLRLLSWLLIVTIGSLLPKNFRDSPENYWEFVRLDRSHAQFGGAKASRHCLAVSALKVFRVLPNYLDPEHAFSEFGRMITVRAGKRC